ncbi:MULTISPECIES: Acb2/Tad1 domain-containing protein [Mycolicibacterium]|uniref:Acb2/Tad1 hairpin domain-containing protein n=1 Tax=Mycobacterium phage Bipper TaxID=1805457 RepID=A0A142F2Q3_9CAUD|nr:MULTISPECIES: hypothetical protein [Mycolicibacterium]YP_009303272.1 hypothetical protein KCH39_gp052 [Mycobacterium phage Bipper]QDF19412.1 hypothetical protein SEA_CRACKLEWINK_126 [Mycobacterium phage Cracklewink]AMQ67060.1 hypothetical protein SEA_BIPPER_125 [Mycobacterium phage Bipper]MCC9181106.1 hypothetical protein [Mycolicibacterium mageritense]UBV14822.1 hypothetical protein H8Z57_29695 [Mycolicibacterium fortuitum]
MYSTQQSSEDIQRRFGEVEDDQRVKAYLLAGKVTELAHYLDATLPPGRDKALALTHLEDVLGRGVRALQRGGK